MTTRAQILVRGIVQGVGFRPFVFLQARRRALRGRVHNDSRGVLIDVEGEAAAIEQLVDALQSQPPPLSRIESITRSGALPAAHFDDFQIARSVGGGERSVLISADIATCADCLHELFDPQDRRYQYPFINCTQCGPRFTIVEGVPYDRALTTMRDFALCAACAAEYVDPSRRRFHAEPVACPSCGPRVYWADTSGRIDPGETATAAVEKAIECLQEGSIVAIKGLGGFHLACDALNASAVARLRQRKLRERKPFALMAESIAIVRRYCHVSETEKQLLLSNRRPIVLLERRADCAVPAELAPGVHTLGFMLPYTPLHHLLLRRFDRPLVMTSGNPSDEPIAYRDAEAIQRLGKIADAFLLHDRRIHMRADDSVARVQADRPIILRRARGYAPEAIRTSFEFARELLACGGQLKNTFCLGKKQHAFISHHIGDLANLDTLRAFAEGVEHFKRLYDVRPDVVAYDLHPDYLSTRYALGLTDVEQRIGIQHHHAHIAACMAEHGLDEPVVGVAFDGTGYGSDGAIWGGEFLLAGLAGYERRAHFRYVALAGGDHAVRQPWRAALSYLQDALGSGAAELELPGWNELDDKKVALARDMIVKGINAVPTSSCGRLFDAISSLLGLRHEASYEAQAAIELENTVCRGIADHYSFDVHSGAPQVIDMRPAIRAIVADIRKRLPTGFIAARFHNTIAAVVDEVCQRLRRAEGVSKVCLSGGVFQNTYLLGRALDLLHRDGFDVFYPGKIPMNDGGISFGQAAVANARIRRGG